MVAEYLGYVKLLEANTPANNALAACGVIVIAPLLMISLMPSKLPAVFVKFLVAFAVGTLLGDVFLHVIPFLLADLPNHQHTAEQDPHHHHEGRGHDHSNPTGTMLAMLGGMLMFLVIDKAIQTASGGGHHHHHDEDNEVHHSHDVSANTTQVKDKHGEGTLQKRNIHSQIQQAIKPNDESPSKSKQETALKSAGYLTLLANLAHTFTDGLTLAIAHYTNPTIAMSTTLAVLLHEIPHKLGDYAILINSGFSKSAAMLMQLWSAVGTAGGVVFGIWLQGEQAKSIASDMDKMVVPVACGGLLYTATVGILPELLETKSLLQFTMQVVAAASGMMLMAWIAVNE